MAVMRDRARALISMIERAVKPAPSTAGIRHGRNKCTPPVIYGLISRVVEALPAKYSRGNRLMQLRGDLHGTYSDVFNTLTPGRGRIEPGHPLGVWPAPSDETPDGGAP